MGLRSFLSRVFGRAPKAPQAPRRIRAGYDSAKTTTENENHWANAGSGSANAENLPDVRARLRNRSREECRNNGYAKGLNRTIRNDVIGTGPRLQLTLPETYVDPDFGTTMTVPPNAARLVEAQWQAWCDRIHLPEKLRTLYETGHRDGECFALMFTNWAVADDCLKLDLRLIEADQISTPDLYWGDQLAVDGIRFDEFGNPVEYHLLKQHPGEPGLLSSPWDYARIRARHVFHWFDPDRPGQRRGVPSNTPGLNLCGSLRRYTKAVIGAAETAASIAGVMETENADDPSFAATTAEQQNREMDEVSVPHRGLLTLPAGYKAHAFDATQPTTSYKEFKGEVLTEYGRPMCAPRNVSTASSAEYNYSSARLDHLPYRQVAKIDREQIRVVILERLFRAWARVALLLCGHLPAGLPPFALWSWKWHWDGFASIDPVKDATADDIGLKNGTRTLADILSEQGKDWQEHLTQRAKEIALARKLETEMNLPPGSIFPMESTTAAPPMTAPEGANAVSV